MALRLVALIGVSTFVALVPGASVSAQYVLSGDTGQEPYIVCKASPIHSDTYYASETVPNNPEASRRFTYHADKYGEQIGDRMYVTCEQYERMTPEYDATWRPGSYQTDEGKTITVERATFLPDGWDTTPTPEEKKATLAGKSRSATPSSGEPPRKSAAQIAAEEAAKRRAEYEAEFQKKQAEYERKLAEQQQQVEDYKRAQEELARTKEQQRLAAEKALADYQGQLAAHAETIRQHDAEVAKYEQELAAQKILKDFDDRHHPGKDKASTDEDANRCVTTAEARLDATFKGNTAASVINGCGQPVDVRICLMTGKGWNCGVVWGVASQSTASHSSFNATGQVFVDARVSGSPQALASPN